MIGPSNCTVPPELHDPPPVEPTSSITVGETRLKVFAIRDPAEIDWNSTGAQIVVESTGHFTDALKAAKLQGKMLLQVHDELVCEVKISQVDQAIEIMKLCMMNAASLAVPLVVDVGIGNNWDEAH
jgi:DNA polymerase-1